jgi:hypothetical protein
MKGACMLARLRAHLTYANVVATLALFLALGGASYAAIRVGSGSIINNSVRTQDLKNNDIRGKDIRNRTIQGGDILTNTLKGQQIRESTLSKVPDADKLDGADSSSYRVSCPAGTLRHAGGCIETTTRTSTRFDTAAEECGTANRRLPNPDELASFSAEPGIDLAPGGEWTSARLGANADLVSEGTGHSTEPASIAHAYRCEAPLAN